MGLRDIRIWREFKGNNIEKLRRHYCRSERSVSQIWFVLVTT
ncbi:hypothetical protein OLL83_001303 [Shewanella algae]|nr:hypothetical protein OLL83_001303 [Shewanella algae]